MTTIPTYVLWLIGGVLPVVALLVGITSVLVNRSTARREHALELLTWAAERAVDPQNPRANSMGTDALDALDQGTLMSKPDKHLLWAINQAVLAPSTSAYPDDTDLSIDVEVADE